MPYDKIAKLDQVAIRMIEAPPLYSSEPVDTVEAAVRLINQMLKGYDREVFGVINLKTDGRPTGHMIGTPVKRPVNFNIVSMGTLDLSAAAVAEPGTAIADQALQQESTGLKVIPRRRSEMTVEDIMEKLENGLNDLFDSEAYKSNLNTMSKFHNYSLNNTLLIAMQKPDATLVVGFNAWKKNFGRHVMKGEKGIRILQPAPYKVRYERDKINPQTGKAVIGSDGKPERETVEIEKTAFRVASVFDVTFDEGDKIEFKEEDGKYHGGYRLLHKTEDNAEFIFLGPDGNKFTMTWWQVLKKMNDNALRSAWDQDDVPLEQRKTHTD